MPIHPPLRKSRQREKILSVLRSTRAHPTAEWVYEQVREDFPKLSLGTVYRNLQILKEQGLAATMPLPGDQTRFDGNVSPHQHFICEGCGRIFDVELAAARMSKKDFDSEGFRVDKVAVTFYGVCGRCQRKQMKKHRRNKR